MLRLNKNPSPKLIYTNIWFYIHQTKKNSTEYFILQWEKYFMSMKWWAFKKNEYADTTLYSSIPITSVFIFFSQWWSINGGYGKHISNLFHMYLCEGDRKRYSVHAETYPVLNSWSDVASSASSPCSSSSAVTKCTSTWDFIKIWNRNIMTSQLSQIADLLLW